MSWKSEKKSEEMEIHDFEREIICKLLTSVLDTHNNFKTFSIIEIDIYMLMSLLFLNLG